MKTSTIDSLSITECCELLKINKETLISDLAALKNLSDQELLLVSQLESLILKDKKAFAGCFSLKDYETYMSAWPDGLYIEMARTRINELHKAKIDSTPSQRKDWKAMLKERHPFVTIFMILLIIASGLGILLSLGPVLWSLTLLADSEWSLIDAYGKGFIPGLLICIIVFIGSVQLLRLNQNGFWMICLCSLLVVFPTIFNEYEEVLFFSVPLSLGLLLYYAILRIRNRGKSLWTMMEAPSRWLKKAALYIWALYMIFIILCPYLLSLSLGFERKLYENGMLIFMAHFRDSSYYSGELAKRMSDGLYGDNFERFQIVDWYEKALRNADEYDDDLFFEYADYLISVNDCDNAYQILQQAHDKYNTSETKDHLESFILQYGQY